MDLNAARMFVSVVAKGSFSMGAKAIGIPVATVSRRIAELEKQLDVRLLERSTRKLRLTQAGSTLYEYASRGLEEFDAGLLALNEQQHELRGILRLSMPPSFEPMWDIIDKFQVLYNNVELDVMVTERRVDFIEDGIDIALRIGALQTESSIARKLTTYSHKLVASPKFLEKYPIKIPNDLLNVPCIAWGKTGQPIRWCLGGNDIDISPKLRVNDYMHIRAMILSSRYISELPPFFCEKLLRTGELVEVLSEYPLQEQAVNLVYPSRNNISRITRAFVDFCKSEIKAIPMLV